MVFNIQEDDTYTDLQTGRKIIKDEAKWNGFKVSIRTSRVKGYKGGDYVNYICHRGQKPRIRPKLTDTSNTRQRDSKKSDCPFNLQLKFVHGAWTVTHKSESSHNHKMLDTQHLRGV